jgi:hypothetical protein
MRGKFASSLRKPSLKSTAGSPLPSHSKPATGRSLVGPVTLTGLPSSGQTNRSCSLGPSTREPMNANFAPPGATRMRPKGPRGASTSDIAPVSSASVKMRSVYFSTAGWSVATMSTRLPSGSQSKSRTAHGSLVSARTAPLATSTVHNRAGFSSRSMTRASSKSFSFFSSASVFGSFAMNAMRLPSGDHRNARTEFFAFVGFQASPPCVDRSQICEPSSRSERKASVRPSGDQCGEDSDLAEFVHLRSSFVSRSKTQMCEACVRPEGGSRSVNASRLPSGENSSSERERVRMASSGLSCADASRGSNRNANRRMRMSQFLCLASSASSARFACSNTV